MVLKNDTIFVNNNNSFNTWYTDANHIENLHAVDDNLFISESKTNANGRVVILNNNGTTQNILQIFSESNSFYQFSKR